MKETFTFVYALTVSNIQDWANVPEWLDYNRDNLFVKTKI